MADPVSSIPLGIRVPEQSGPNIGTIGQFAQVQNWLNTSRLFQQTFAARMKAGELLATSDPSDPESGIRALMQDPQTAAFAPEIINSIRAGQNTLVDMQGKQQQQAQSGFQAFLKSLPAAIADPTMLPGLIQANLAQLPKGSTISPNVRESMRDVVTSLMDGLPADKAAAGQMFRSRLAGLTMSAGITPEVINTLVPKATETDLGGYKAFGVQQPGLMGGGFQEANRVPMSVKPEIVFPPGMGPGGATAPLLTGPGGVGIAPGASTPSPGTPVGGTSSTGGPVPGMSTPTTPPMGLTLQQQKDTEKIAERKGQIQSELSDRIRAGNNMMQTIGEAREAMQKFTPGPGASVNLRVAQIARFFGASDDLYNRIANGDAGASQEMQKLMVNTTMDQLRNQIQGLGKLNRQEFEVFSRANPNIDTDPRAIDRIFDFWTKLHQINLSEQPELANYLAKGGNPYTWDSEWSTRLQQRGQLHFSSQGGEAPGTVASPPIKQRGTPSPGSATHRYNPATGKIEPIQ